MRAFTNKTHVRSRCSTLIQHSPACYNRMFTLPHSCSIPCSTFLIYSQIPAGESLSLRQRIRTRHHYRHGGIIGYFCLFPYQGVAKHFIVCKRCKRLELGTERDQQTDKLLTKVKHRGGDCGAICEMPHANINITRGHTHTHTKTLMDSHMHACTKYSQGHDYSTWKCTHQESKNTHTHS